MSKTHNEARTTPENGDIRRIKAEVAPLVKAHCDTAKRSSAEVERLFWQIVDAEHAAAELAMARTIDYQTEQREIQAVSDEYDHERQARDAVFRHALAGNVIRQNLDSQHTPQTMPAEISQELQAGIEAFQQILPENVSHNDVTLAA